MLTFRGREVPKEDLEDLAKGVHSFRIVFWFLSLCFLVLSILLVCVIGYRFYLVGSGEEVQGYIREKHLVTARRGPGGYAYDGDFSYNGKTYKISAVGTFDKYDIGPVQVYFNPKKPSFYVIHQEGLNKYLMVLFYGYELETLGTLIALGVVTTFGPMVFKVHSKKDKISKVNQPQ
jgi:hypothetical protein